MMHKLAAVVILYHPNESVYQNIQTYLSFIDKLYIVDNSETSDTLNQKFYTLPKSMVLHRGENIGIAKALNLALAKAVKDNFSWLMTMDQDSSFTSTQINLYMKDFHSMDLDNIAIISPLHNEKFLLQADQEKSKFSHELFVMTSANIVNIMKVSEVGGYDENLFIDEVDHELGFRLNKYGYHIIQNNEVFVTHHLGQRYRERSNITVYPPLRLYYMVRNYLYLKKKYFAEYRSFFKGRDKYLVKFFLLQLLFNGRFFNSIEMIIKGIQDYRNNKLGKKI